MKKKYMALLCLCLMALSTSVILSIEITYKTPTEIETGIYSIPLNTYWCVDFKPAGGEWQDLGCKHNVFTNAGKNHVMGLLNGTITANEKTTYLALGNTSEPSASSTTLAGEQTDCGLARTEGNKYVLGVGNWEVNNTFTYSCSVNRVVNTTAAFNSAASGTLFAGGTITSVTFTTNGDQVRLRHIYTLSET